MGVPFGVFLGRFRFHLTFPHAVGVAFDQSDVGVVGEAVEERGKRNISIVNLEVIAKGFGLSLSRLLSKV